MNGRVATTCCFLAMCWQGIEVPVFAGEKPASTVQAVVESARPPDTLAQLIDAASIVVLARVHATGQPEVQGQRMQRVWRKQHVKVLEVLKGPESLKPGASLIVRQAGGTAAAAGHDVVSDYQMRLFEKDDVVLLFLIPAPGNPDTFDVAFDQNGALWQKEDGTVDVPIALQKMPEIGERRTRSLEDLKAAIRRIGPKSK